MLFHQKKIESSGKGVSIKILNSIANIYTFFKITEIHFWLNFRSNHRRDPVRWREEEDQKSKFFDVGNRARYRSLNISSWAFEAVFDVIECKKKKTKRSIGLNYPKYGFQGLKQAPLHDNHNWKFSKFSVKPPSSLKIAFDFLKVKLHQKNLFERWKLKKKYPCRYFNR